MTGIAYALLALAALLGVAGKYEAGLFVAIASLAVAVFGPSDEQQDARRRNHAHRVREWYR